jgi:hypothetical protein
VVTPLFGSFGFVRFPSPAHSCYWLPLSKLTVKIIDSGRSWTRIWTWEVQLDATTNASGIGKSVSDICSLGRHSAREEARALYRMIGEENTVDVQVHFWRRWPADFRQVHYCQLWDSLRAMRTVRIPGMFEITGNDVALLNDKDLRTLVGRLCESEVRNRELSPSSVTWSGDQNAADGGLDVRVALPDGAVIDGFVPRPATGFQVKSSDMPRAEILDEMRPKGTLRPVICDLANRSGAYIIASSTGSTSDIALQNRRDAMKEAVRDLPNAAALTFEFYDRGRLATWVRQHAGLILWVREKIGRSIHGWRSYGDWAYAPDGTEDKYLLDDMPRFLANADARDGSLPASESIKRFRERLRNPRAVVRLVGLSGVGKTRFVQALFDHRVGENSLDPSIACYTNLADGPDPPPAILATDLIASRQRAILIVDNCPPDLHQRLSEQSRSPESLLSLITIEYDIREDQAEGTDVFLLQPSSTNLMETLVNNRFRGISPLDARTVAEFSGGNARIAIALASTIGKNETIAGLRDEELFRRLFQQRNEPSQSLLLAAQALSLVYSFQGEDVSDGPEGELRKLGALIGKSAQEMFQHVADLERRGLVQRRSRWRAVLPHAIANRLAAMAFQNIPFAGIQEHLANGDSPRLLKSFSRRLGFLDGNREARNVVMGWLKPKGLLEDLANLDDFHYEMFNNIAPVAPEATLSALERVLLDLTDPEAPAKCKRYLHVLRLIAYEPALFERSVKLIVKIGATENADDRESEAGRVLASLFPLYLSGTHATNEQRLKVIKSLVLSSDRKKEAIGLMAVKAMLEAWHYGPAYNFEFGARSRDYGYQPKNIDDAKQWFEKTLRFAEAHASTDEPMASEVRTAIAQQFRGLWNCAVAYDDLERVCRSISNRNFWTSGWIAVRETMVYDGAGFTPEIFARLSALEEVLRPKDTVQKVRSIVLSDAVTYVGVDSTDSKDIENNLLKVETAAHELGKLVAMDQVAFDKLMPELIAGNTQQTLEFRRRSSRWRRQSGSALVSND